MKEGRKALPASGKNIKWNFFLYYFFIFFAIGSLSPLLPVYLRGEGLTGSQMGLLLSMSPVIMIMIQPVWGMLSDQTKRPIGLLTIALCCASLFGILYSFVHQYSFLLLAAVLLAVFQSALIPLSDSVAVSYAHKSGTPYGAIRLWGAIGFAISVVLLGKLSEIFHLSIIFYAFAFVLIAAAFLVRRLPNDHSGIKTGFKKGLKELSGVPAYFVFLLISFLVLGPILANNFYFGIYIDHLGGGLSGIGIAFFLAAGSEAPFMSFAGKWISRFGIKRILFAAALISTIRWFMYFFEPPLAVIYATTIVQGFSTGLFIPAALQYVKDIAPVSVGATAISLYSAVGNGLGNWFCTFLSGMIYEKFSILSVYLFFGVMSAAALVILLGLKTAPAVTMVKKAG